MYILYVVVMTRQVIYGIFQYIKDGKFQKLSYSFCIRFLFFIAIIVSYIFSMNLF